MSKKPLTPEQRERKNRRQRERYQALRQAGLSPTQARKPADAVKEKPGLFKKASKIVKGLAERVGLVDSTPKKGEPTKRKTRKQSVKKKAARRDYSDFIKFAKAHLHLSANAIIKAYAATGGKITKQKAYEIIRDLKGKPRDLTKVHTIKYQSNNKYRLYPKEIRKVYLKERYMYLMRFDVERLGYLEYDTEYVTIASPGKLDFETLVNETINMWEEAQAGAVKEKYQALRIIPESIGLIRAIDTDME